MKLSLLLILPCFLTISTVSSGSIGVNRGATFSDTENSSIVANAQTPGSDTARRGSGRRESVVASAHARGRSARRGSGRRAVLAHSWMIGQTA